MASSTIKGLTIEIGGDTTKLGKAIQDAEKKSKALSSELSEVNKLLKTDPSNMDMLAQKQQLLTEAVAATKEKLDTLKEAEKQAQAQFERGEISSEQYRALQREIMYTENKLEGYEKAIEKTSAAMTEARMKTDKEASSMEELTAKISIQESDLGRLKEKYTETVLTLGKNSTEAEKLAGEIQTLSGDLKTNKDRLAEAANAADSLDKTMEDVSGSTDDAGESARQAASSFDTASAAVGTFIGNLALDVLREAVSLLKTVASDMLDTGMSFESQMSTVKSLISGSYDTEEELAAATGRLTDKAKELGETTAYTSTEVGEAFEYMAMAGWSEEDMLASVSGVMSLAAASGEELATVSDIVTDSMTALGLTANGEYADGISNAAHYSDVLAAAATNANTTVSLLGESFKYCAPVAGTMGASAEDLSIALGLMANAGIKGSQAGNTLKNALVNMSNPTNEQAEAMQALGIEITNTDGSYKSLQDIMGELRSAMSAVNVELVDAEGNVRDYDDIIADLSATEEGLTQAEQLKNAAVIFGKSNLAGMLAIINSTDEDYQALTESIYNCNGAAEQIADTKLDNLQGDIVLLQSAWDGLNQTIYESVNTQIRGIVQSVTGELLPALTDLINGVEGADEEVGKALSGLAETILQMLVGYLPDIANIATSLILTLADALIGMLPELVNTAGTIVLTLLEGLAEIAPQLIIKLSEILPDIINAIIGMLPQLLEASIKLFMALVQALPTVVENLVAALPTMIETLTTALVQMLPELISAIVNFMVECNPQLVEAAFALLLAIVDAIPMLIDALLPVLPDIIAAILQSLNDAAPQLLNTAFNVFCRIVNGLSSISTSLNQALLKIIAAIVKAIISWDSKVIEAISKIIKSISNKLSTMPDEAKTIGENIIKGLWNGINSYINWFTEKISAFASGIISTITGIFDIHSPSRKMAWVGRMVDEGLANGLEEGADAPLTAMEDMADRLMDVNLVNPDSIQIPHSAQSTGEAAAYGTAPDLSEMLGMLGRILQAVENGQVLTIDGEQLVGATADMYDKKFGEMQVLQARGGAR
jgi:phage-related minor tail protein